MGGETSWESGLKGESNASIRGEIIFEIKDIFALNREEAGFHKVQWSRTVRGTKFKCTDAEEQAQTQTRKHIAQRQAAHHRGNGMSGWRSLHKRSRLAKYVQYTGAAVQPAGACLGSVREPEMVQKETALCSTFAQLWRSL